jgi:heat shock protein HslJ
MKRSKFYFVLLLIIFSSCEKENVDNHIDLTLHEWQVIKYREYGKISYSVVKERYVLKFNNIDKTLGFNLDVNNCGGNYKILGNSNIEIENPYCTEICCDSEQAEEFVRLIPKMTKYSLEDNRLVFEGQGEIIFIKYR